jgi:hypothetical protein
VAAALLVMAATAGGFVVGHNGAPDATDAARTRAAAYADALRRAEPVAYLSGRHRGEAEGRRIGARQGRTAGRKAGRRRARKELARRASAKAATAAKAKAGKAEAGPPYERLGCGGDPYAAYGPRGCIPPAHPPTPPARPEDCPAGQVPVGVTGACARPE